MRRALVPSALFAVGVVFVAVACGTGQGQPDEAHAEGAEEEEAELALHMSRLQRWTHKTALALQARNPELADFYLHEMEESIETIKTEAPTYEGYAIAEQTGQILDPSVEALDAALANRDWAAVDARLSELARSCNQCHQVTDHGVVKIDLDDVPNPYPQDFSTNK